MYLDHTFGLGLSLSELAQRKLSQKVKSPIVDVTLELFARINDEWNC